MCMCGSGCGCGSGYCGKCSAMQVLVLGILVVANAFWGWIDWTLFIGAVLVIVGVSKLVMPSCPCNKGGCCEGSCGPEEMPKAAPKKKK